VKREPRLGVVIQNRGLYAEMAEATRRLLPDLLDLAFVIGMDKVPQLFEARYYGDMEAELDRLFQRARFLVAPRGAGDRRDLETVLSTPAIRRFADRFSWLSLPESWRDVSASLARQAWGRDDTAERLLPGEVVEFLYRTGAFAEPARYQRRAESIQTGTAKSQKRPRSDRFA
ncbi:MAG: hypothetical protein ACREQ9_16600, partial [Candidatus Binatia bacterium]